VSLFIAVYEDQVILHSGDERNGFILRMDPEDAMSLVTSLLDASKAAASNIMGQSIWGTPDNRFLDERHADEVEAQVSYVYSGS
jgi:hypothetical protein